MATLTGPELEDFELDDSDQAAESEESYFEEERAAEWKRQRIMQWNAAIEDDVNRPAEPSLRQKMEWYSAREEGDKLVYYPGGQSDEDDGSGKEGTIRLLEYEGGPTQETQLMPGMLQKPARESRRP